MIKSTKILFCLFLTFTSTFVSSQNLCEKNVEENIICSNQELNALSNNFLKLYSEYKFINSNFSESTKSELNNKLQQCAEDVSCINGSLISSINILKNNLENSQKENNKSTIQEQVPFSDKNTNGNNQVVSPSEKNNQIKDQTPDSSGIISFLKDPYVYGAIIYLILFGFLNFAKNNPDLGGVFIAMDSSYNFLVQAQLLNREGQPVKFISLNDFKKVGEEYIIKQLDVLDEVSHDKTRFEVNGAAMNLKIDPKFFLPESLNGENPKISSDNYSFFQ